MAWTASFEPRALDEFEELDKPIQKRIVRFLQDRILSRNDPRMLGKALTGDRAGLWRYRVGDYRVIARLNDQHETVLILRIAHRKEAYR